MPLSPKSWLPKAEGLAPGRSIRVDHDCGGGRTLLIRNDQGGLNAFCFRCNEPGRAPAPQLSLAERLDQSKRLERGDARIQRSQALPLPQVCDPSDWPVAARLWFARAGLSATDALQLGAYYHTESERLVLPVRDDKGEVVFWQARSLDGRQPKYMAPSVDKAEVLPRWGSAPSPTLVEDILSAYKVGLVGEGWALMGTKVSPKVIRLLLERGGTVNVWMDNDLPPLFPVNRGQIAARKIIKTLSAYGIKTRNIVSDVDPKLLFRDRIKELLNA